jgi:predicted enzyme related to lactoylglutathione lyase
MSRVNWFDISAKNPDKEMKFFHETFGWDFKKWEGGNMEYWMINTGSEKEPGINGGLSKESEQTMEPVNTIGVKDVDKTLETIKKNGGTVVEEKMTLPGVGYMAYFKDPEGNEFGIMASDENAK